MSKTHIITTALLCASVAAVAQSTPGDLIGNIRVISDSIGNGMTPWLQSELSEFNATHPRTNCRGTRRCGDYVRKWVRPRDYDVVLFNAGIWDADSNGPEYASVEEYEENLYRIFDVLLGETPNVVAYASVMLSGRDDSNALNNDVLSEYNAALRRVCAAFVIPVIPLDKFTDPRDSVAESYRRSDGMHYTPEGYAVLARYVVSQMELILGRDFLHGERVILKPEGSERRKKR